MGPTSVTDAHTQDQVAHVKLNLHENVPTLCHVAQVGANWPEFGAIYAQIGPIQTCSAQLRPRLGQVASVGPSRPAPVLSIQFSGRGHRDMSRSDSNMGPESSALSKHKTAFESQSRRGCYNLRPFNSGANVLQLVIPKTTEQEPEPQIAAKHFSEK